KRGHDQLLCEMSSATWRQRIVSKLRCQTKGETAGPHSQWNGSDWGLDVQVKRLPRSGLVQRTLCNANGHWALVAQTWLQRFVRERRKGAESGPTRVASGSTGRAACRLTLRLDREPELGWRDPPGIGPLPRVLMKSLCRRSRFHIETLYGGALDGARSARRAFMLDVAFIALGFVVIGLMATYAAGLRRL